MPTTDELETATMAAIVSMGSVIAIIGIIVSSILLKKDKKDQIPLIISMVGFSLVIITAFYFLFIKQLFAPPYDLIIFIVITILSIFCCITSLCMISSDTPNNKTFIIIIKIFLCFGLVFSSFLQMIPIGVLLNSLVDDDAGTEDST